MVNITFEEFKERNKNPPLCLNCGAQTKHFKEKATKKMGQIIIEYVIIFSCKNCKGSVLSKFILKEIDLRAFISTQGSFFYLYGVDPGSENLTGCFAKQNIKH